MIPETIINDLKQGLSLEETLIKHGTNLKEVFHKNYVPGVIDDWTYIQPTPWNTFRVAKTIHGTRKEFGTYKSHNEALTVRNQLMECEWDKSRLPEIWETYGVTPPQWGGVR